MLKYGFFNSKDYDRVYDAESFTSIITNFLDTPGIARYINRHDGTSGRDNGCEYLFSDRGGSIPVMYCINYYGSIIYFKHAYMYDDEDVYINFGKYKDDELKDLNNIPNSCVRAAIVAYADYLNRHVGYDVIFGNISYDGSYYDDPVIESNDDIEYLLLATTDLKNVVTNGYGISDINYEIVEWKRYTWNKSINSDVKTFFGLDNYFKQYDMQDKFVDGQLAKGASAFDNKIKDDINSLRASLNAWIESKNQEIKTWQQSVSPSGLTPEQVWNLNNELSIIRSTYVDKDSLIVKRTEIVKGDEDHIPVSSLVYQIFQDPHSTKAVINVTTDTAAFFNKKLVVTNESGDISAITSFDSNGSATVKLLDLGTYTFTVTY